MGNQFLSHVRGVQLAVIVVRAFEDSKVTHVSDRVDPVADAEVVELELALADLAQVERRMERRRLSPLEAETLAVLSKHLDAGLPARTAELSQLQRDSLPNLDLLTAKPMLYAVNVAEEDLATAQSGNHGSALHRAFFDYAKVR
jgi:ribosome-binding ATPase YchF (GTP1/OBG family)